MPNSYRAATSIKFESADGIARVTLGAPERRNALTPGG
jgi:1,4-dihydroxy-2-naphthoyl-CoA synthase